MVTVIVMVVVVMVTATQELLGGKARGGYVVVCPSVRLPGSRNGGAVLLPISSVRNLVYVCHVQGIKYDTRNLSELKFS